MPLANQYCFNEALKPRASSADACNSQIIGFKETRKSKAFLQTSAFSQRIVKYNIIGPDEL
jgi:hypothetical protein